MGGGNMNDLDVKAASGGKIALYVRLTSYGMAMLAALSLCRAVYLYGASNISGIKIILFVGLLLISFVVLPLVVAVKKNLPSNPIVFIQKADRFNNTIGFPCITILVFALIASSTWKAGDWERDVGRCMGTISDFLNCRYHPSQNLQSKAPAFSSVSTQSFSTSEISLPPLQNMTNQ
jgi:hypothetical protein